MNKEIAARLVAEWESRTDEIVGSEGELWLAVPEGAHGATALLASGEASQWNHQGPGWVCENDYEMAKRLMGVTDRKRIDSRSELNACIQFAVRLLVELDTEQKLRAAHIVDIPLIRQAQEQARISEETLRRTVNKALPSYAKPPGRPREEELPEVCLKLPQNKKT